MVCFIYVWFLWGLKNWIIFNIFCKNIKHYKWLGTSWKDDAQQTKAAIEGKKVDWLIIDHYAIDTNWETALRSHVKRIMVIDDLADQVTELEEQLNKTTEDNIQLHEKAQSYERADIVRKQSSGLAVTEAEKLASLVEDIEFDDAETFEMKVKTIKESYFEKEVKESVDEADALVGNEESTIETSDTMAAYTQAISKHIK